MSIRVNDLIRFTAGEPLVAAALRLDDLAGRGNYSNTILPGFKRDGNKVTDNFATGIATAAVMFELSHTSTTAQLREFVYRAVQGWGVRITKKTPEDRKLVARACSGSR